MPFAVVVRFQIDPSQWDDFMPLMLKNAKTSREIEAGCLQFDVAHDPETPNEVFLYEVYDDRAAFEAHLASAHFQEFDGLVQDMIVAKDVQTYGDVHR